MRVGVVTKWFNRGQAYIASQMRSALEQLGHESFVLARPSRDRGPNPAQLERGGEWAQPGVTEASSWEVPESEYLAWADANGLDAVLCDNCFQFDEIAALRASGVRTAGRFIWEFFAPEHAEGANRAFDAVYSLTRCEHERYAGLGVDSTLIRWGIHPELLGAEPDRSGEQVRLLSLIHI